MKKSIVVALLVSLLLAAAGLNTSWSGGVVVAQFATVPSRTPSCSPQLVLRAMSIPPEGLIVSLWVDYEPNERLVPTGSMIEEKPFQDMAVAFSVSRDGQYQVWGWVPDGGWLYLGEHAQEGCDSFEMLVLESEGNLITDTPTSPAAEIQPTMVAVLTNTPTETPVPVPIVIPTLATVTIRPTLAPSMTPSPVIVEQPTDMPVDSGTDDMDSQRPSWGFLVGGALVVAAGVFIFSSLRRR